MMRTLAAACLSASVTFGGIAQAQDAAGVIAGIVRDMADRPMANIEVFAFPGDHRARTDAGGRFTMRGLPPGQYVVRARRVGLQPAAVTATVPVNGTVDVELRFTRVFPTLDTVVVKGAADCEKHSLNGFMCRRNSATGGVFLDYNDIASRQYEYPGDLYRGIEGFRVDFVGTREGIRPQPVPITGWRCMKHLVNGWTPMLFNRAPEKTSEIMAMEIYADPDHVPEEYQVYTWPAADYRTVRRSRGATGTPRFNPSGRCSLTVYWTFEGLKRR
jgi:hypothetical protein